MAKHGKLVAKVSARGEVIGEIRKTPFGQYDARDFGASVHSFRRDLEGAMAFFTDCGGYGRVAFQWAK